MMPEEFSYVYRWEGKKTPVKCDWEDQNIRTAIIRDVAETAGVNIQDVRVLMNVVPDINNAKLLIWTNDRTTSVPSINRKWSVAITLRKPPREFARLAFANIPHFLQQAIQRQKPAPIRLPETAAKEPVKS